MSGAKEERPACPVTVGEARLVAEQIRKAARTHGRIDAGYWPFIIEELCRQLEEARGGVGRISMRSHV